MVTVWIDAFGWSTHRFLARNRRFICWVTDLVHCFKRQHIPSPVGTYFGECIVVGILMMQHLDAKETKIVTCDVHQMYSMNTQCMSYVSPATKNVINYLI